MAVSANRTNGHGERDRQKTAAERAAERQSQEALDRGKAVADQTLEASRRIAEDAADITRKGSETVQQTVQATVEMGTRMAERSMNQIASAVGFPSERTDEAVQQSSRNLKVMFDTEVVLIDAVQKLQQDWMEGVQARLQQRIEAFQALLGCRTPAEAITIQTDLARRQMESFIGAGQRASELFSKSAGAALRKVKVGENSDRA